MFVLPSGTACATRRRVPFFRVRACSEIFGARWLAFSAVGALGAPVQYAGASLRSFVWHRPFAFPDVRAGLGSSVWHRPLSSPNFRASHSFPSSSCSRFFSSKKNGKKNSHMQLEFLKAEQKEEERNRKEDERTKRCEKIQDEKNKTTAYYLAGVVFFTLAMSYAAVPLYRIFCQVTGFGGTVQQTHGGVAKLSEDLSKTNGSPPRTIKINFNADTDADMPWTFKPSQGSIWAEVGETVLAFYNAKNESDKNIIGVATYNVTPNEAGLYFNKIQCFCFDEQRLQPREEVEMPVFFYIDPKINQDKRLGRLNEITLSYTFFQTEVEEDEATQAAGSS